MDFIFSFHHDADADRCGWNDVTVDKAKERNATLRYDITSEESRLRCLTCDLKKLRG